METVKNLTMINPLALLKRLAASPATPRPTQRLKPKRERRYEMRDRIRATKARKSA
jgi:hypothetical protein